MDKQILAKKSKQAAWISAFGFVMVIIAFLFAGNGISKLSEEKSQLVEEKEFLSGQIDSLFEVKKQLHDEYVSLVKGFGWTEKQIALVSASDPRFLDAVRSINEIRSLLGEFRANPESTNIGEMHVTYTMLEEDFSSIEKALSTINIETQFQPSINDDKTNIGINEIRHAQGMLPNDIKLVAFSLLSAGIELNSIKTDSTLLPNTIELGLYIDENLIRISAADIKAGKGLGQ